MRKHSHVRHEGRVRQFGNRKNGRRHDLGMACRELPRGDERHLQIVDSAAPDFLRSMVEQRPNECHRFLVAELRAQSSLGVERHVWIRCQTSQRFENERIDFSYAAFVSTTS